MTSEGIYRADRLETPRLLVLDPAVADAQNQDCGIGEATLGVGNHIAELVAVFREVALSGHHNIQAVLQHHKVVG